MLAVSATAVVGTFFFRLLHIFHFSLSLEDGPIQTEIVSKDN